MTNPDPSTPHQIVIAGSGFAGVWAAIAAARVIAEAGANVAVTVVSPEPTLGIRPRFYEAGLDGLAPDVSALFAAIDVRHLPGVIETVGADRCEAHVLRADGTRETLAWDRFVLAAGSRLSMPPIPGLAEHAFNVDTLAAARRLDAHLRALEQRPADPARDTVVVVGGGFTGLETAAEMPERLRALFGDDAALRVVLVDPAPLLAADMGADAAAEVRGALAELGVETRSGERAAAIDDAGVTLSDGSRIDAATVIWTAGVRAHPLAAELRGAHDAAGRVIGDAFLRAGDEPLVFAAGDAVAAATDDLGNTTLMTCQHALSLGRVAGHNAAADLLGLPLHAYSQPKYVTCLDLGGWGALYTEGWDRQVRLTRAEGKAVKREINGVWIYPPTDREAAFAVAQPGFVIVP